MLRVYTTYEDIEKKIYEEFLSAKEWLDTFTVYDPNHPFSYAYHELNGSDADRTLLISRKPHYHDFVRRYAYVRGETADLNEISALLPEWSPSSSRKYSVLEEHFRNLDVGLVTFKKMLDHMPGMDTDYIREATKYTEDAHKNLADLWEHMKEDKDADYKASLPFPMNVFPKRTTDG